MVILLKPTREELIKAYTETAGGCSSCYAGNKYIRLSPDQVADILIAGEGKTVKISEEGITDESIQ